MLTIGEFSKLGHVTKKALRHWDEIGLLRPNRMPNGYRYYAMAQLGTVRMIHRLKAYDFSLPEIGEMLAQAENTEYLAQRLLARRDALASQLASTRLLMKQLEADAASVQKGENMMNHTLNIQTKTPAPMTIYSIRRDMGVADFGPAFGELFRDVGMMGLQVAGPMVALYHDEEFNPEHSDIEVGVTVQGEGKGVRTLNPGLCACAVYEGAFGDRYAEVYTALAQWIGENGYAINGPAMDIYLESDPAGPGGDKNRTEICFPVRRG